MNRGGQISDSIPIDLILDILSRLPVKSIARFHCVSKLWWSLLHKPYFTELFLTRSWARPRLLIGVRQAGEWCFFSSPQPQNPYEKSSLVVAADFHMKISTYDRCSYASGLLYFPSIQFSEKDEDEMKVICNPSTGEYAILPELRTSYNWGVNFLGFDPIGKQFKVLAINNSVNGERVYHILTLGTETLRWRKIQGPSNHYPFGNGICINGVLYYIYSNEDNIYHLGCFDVRCEKCEWSTYVYTSRTDEHKVLRAGNHISVVGVTALGEIVLAKEDACKPFYVLYFNPERNTFLYVEIQGIREEWKEWYGQHPVCVFVDHVEDLKFDVMKTTYAATSISRPEESTSSKEDHQVRTVTHQLQDHHKDHQVRTVAHQRQDRRTFECVNKFHALRFLEDD